MNFTIFMLAILLVSGLIWLMDILVLHKRRQSAFGDVADPWYVEYSKSFFPVILLVFMVRSFIAEPFKIPSGSMMPTLLSGDYILVNKFTYGLRVPILNSLFYPVSLPQRGDVFVFHYPRDTSSEYIKRVVGLPGDKIQYRDKQLTINGKVINLDFVQQYSQGSLGYRLMQGETITVPEGEYFAMGDNRDNSSDSRAWGFVSERHLVGKAQFIWFNFDQWRRIGQHIG